MKKIFKFTLISFLILFFLNGCTSVNSFQSVELVSVADIDPIIVKNNFKNKIPQEYQVASSIFFQYFWRSFYSLDYLTIDLNEDSFVLAALDPAGVRLFQLTDNNGKVKYSTSIEKLEKLSPYIRYIAEDIRNIYFNNIPPESFTIAKYKDKIVFFDIKRDEKLEYTFGGKNSNLLNKEFLKKRSWFLRLFLNDYYTVWSVGYFGYEMKDGKLYPKNIFYQNNNFGYTLTIRLKEIL